MRLCGGGCLAAGAVTFAPVPSRPMTKPVMLDIWYEHSKLRADVQARSWEWLFALRGAMNTVVQVLDDGLTPIVRDPHAGDDFCTMAPRFLTASAEAARGTGTPQSVVVPGWQCVCVPLDRTSGSGGLLLVARHADSASSPAGQPRIDIEVLARWLASAVEAHLSSQPSVIPDAAQRVASLHQVLAKAGGTDREIIAGFAEAMAVWHDLEFAAYVPDDDAFACAVVLPGADLARTEVRLAPPAGVAWEPFRPVPLEEDGADPRTQRSIVRLPAVGGDGNWVLALRQPADMQPDAPIQAYLSVLNAALVYAVGQAHGRIVPALSRELQLNDHLPRAAAERTLELARRQLGATALLLDVQNCAGVSAMRIVAGESPCSGMCDFIAHRSAGSLTLVLRASFRGRHVSPHERQLTNAVADVFQRWTAGIAGTFA